MSDVYLMSRRNPVRTEAMEELARLKAEIQRRNDHEHFMSVKREEKRKMDERGQALLIWVIQVGAFAFFCMLLLISFLTR